MECPRETKMIKTFRSMMAPDTQDTIVLHTNDGQVGYRMVDFRVISQHPTGFSPEAVLQVWKVSQATNEYTINFSNNTLVAAAFYENNQNVAAEGASVIIFDKEIFNQDIYVTCRSTDGPMNYYIELEQVKLDLNENTVATLKDIRNLDVAI